MIKITLDESRAFDESKAIIPASKIVSWYKDPANAGKSGRSSIKKTLDSLGLTIDDLVDQYSSLDWGDKVNMSRDVRGW